VNLGAHPDLGTGAIVVGASLIVASCLAGFAGRLLLAVGLAVGASVAAALALAQAVAATTARQSIAAPSGFRRNQAGSWMRDAP
jgi:cell division protein FtsW (lipid II flippase)